MYKIKKIINNNVVIVQDSKLREYVVFGKAIGFGRKENQLVETDIIERKYLLANDQNEYIVNMLETSSSKLLDACYEIKKLAEAKYKMEYTSYSYFSLIDHISNTISRQKLNVKMSETVTIHDLQMYHNELELAKQAKQLIEERLDVKLSENEIVYLTMHFISYVYDSNYLLLNEHVLKIINEILDIIRYDNNMMDRESFALQRLLVHLKFFILRNLQNDGQVEGVENKMLNSMVNQYPKASETLEKICSYLYRTYEFKISNDEKLYLMIHISKIL